MENFWLENGDLILKLALAMLFGVIIGAERVFVHKEAGMKTHALVAVGAALFIIVSETMAKTYIGIADFDPSRIASQVVVGIGFLGAGSIIFQGNRLAGLTTAAGLWVTAGIGMAVGFGLFMPAALATVAVLLIFIVVNIFEKPIKKISNKSSESSAENDLS